MIRHPNQISRSTKQSLGAHLMGQVVDGEDGAGVLVHSKRSVLCSNVSGNIKTGRV
jgi:hypothetical protein